jgi:hypothetical protein
MTLFKSLPIAALLLLTASSAAAQQADFSGAWAMDMTRSESAHQSEPVPPVTLLMQQDGSNLTIERRQGDEVRKVVYVPGGLTNDTTREPGTGELRWNGARMVTETVHIIRGATVTQVQTYSLSDDRREMTVESALKIEHGYEGVLPTLATPAAASQGKDIYVRR